MPSARTRPCWTGRSCAWRLTAVPCSTAAGAIGHFVAFDVLSINGDELRHLPLVARKRHLRAIMPRMESRVIYLDHIDDRGAALFAAVCQRDLEGVVSKWKRGRYHSDGQTTSWLKIRNPEYSQVARRSGVALQQAATPRHPTARRRLRHAVAPQWRAGSG